MINSYSDLLSTVNDFDTSTLKTRFLYLTPYFLHSIDMALVTLHTLIQCLSIFTDYIWGSMGAFKGRVKYGIFEEKIVGTHCYNPMKLALFCRE